MVSAGHMGIADNAPVDGREPQNPDWRFRAFFEGAPVGMLICTKEGRFIRTNEAFRKMLGWTDDELSKMTFWEITHPDDLEENRRLVAETHTRERDSFQLTKRYRRKDGSYVWVDVTSNPIRDTKGNVLFGTAVLQDITDRIQSAEAVKKSEEWLHQAQKMEAIGQLAGGIAHDFNNILTAILGFNGLLLDHLGEEHPLRKYAEQTRTAAERAAELTRQLLAFSRKQLLEIKVEGLNEIVSGVSKILQRLLGEDIQLVLMLSPETVNVRVDSGQMGQVIMNLAINARDAMPKGGKLIIETTNVELDETYAAGHVEVQPGPYVQLTVSDTGCGMDAATLAHIFEPFFTTKEVGRGTGLGLSMVYGIVKQCGGHIWAYSEAGKGTAFIIHLPRIDAVVQGIAGVPLRKQLPAGIETVLVVEDEEMLRSLARSILEGLGYVVLDAGSGEGAIALLDKESRPVHLMLTDVVMPGISGVELAARMKPVRPDMKVLFMSGYTDNVILRHGVSARTVAFLQKPFTREVLANRVREVLDAPGRTG